MEHVNFFPNHTIHANFIPVMLIHTFHSERVGGFNEIITITGNDIFRLRSPW